MVNTIMQYNTLTSRTCELYMLPFCVYMKLYMKHRLKATEATGVSAQTLHERLAHRLLCITAVYASLAPTSHHHTEA
jgi:hypothetical protein